MYVLHRALKRAAATGRTTGSVEFQNSNFSSRNVQGPRFLRDRVAQSFCEQRSAVHIETSACLKTREFHRYL